MIQSTTAQSAMRLQINKIRLIIIDRVRRFKNFNIFKKFIYLFHRISIQLNGSGPTCNVLSGNTSAKIKLNLFCVVFYLENYNFYQIRAKD
jgi:hypothetical protein